jgi:branched-chain amino acid transport system substrate-binding protein
VITAGVGSRSAKLIALVVVLATAFVATGIAGASGVPAVRGFDDGTITVGGFGNEGTFKGADIGAIARFQRANDTKEVKGVTFDYVGFADDKNDPAVATSEARRLVTQEGVFAIVPDLSTVNPGPYLTQQRVPYVGFAFDGTYCSTTPSTSLYGFGFTGCAVPTAPKSMPDTYAGNYAYVVEKTGKKHPSIAMISSDIQSGKEAAKYTATSMEGAGFKVVYAKGTVPTQATDYTPYVQDLMHADDGHQPDAISCALSAQCIAFWDSLQAAGFTGTFSSNLGIDLLAGPLKGTVALNFWNTEPSPALTQMQADFTAAGAPAATPIYSETTYFAADMFIQAVKAVVAKSGAKGLTPEAVQKALSTITWEIKGLAGPIKYPAATVMSTPACGELILSTGTPPWTVAEPYACSTKRFKVNPKFTGS